MSTVYQTKVTATGGRNGQITSEDGVLNLEVRIPKAMGGPGGSYSNPEQLFAAGYAACFDSALNLVASQQKIKVNSKVHATVGIQMTEKDGFNIVAALEVEIPGIERAIAQDLLEKAHAVCPYSKAIHNNVVVTITLL